MAEDHQNKTGEDKQERQPPSPPSGEHQDDSQTDSNKTAPADQTCKYVQQQLPNIIVNYEKADDTQAVRANTISNRMLYAAIIASIVSFGLLVATYFIWKATKDSVKVANDALLDGRKKDSASKISDSVSLDRQDSAYARNGRDSRERFLLDSNSTADQIKNLKRTLAQNQRQFELSNRPFIFLEGFSIDSIGEGPKWEINFNICNSGKFPAQIVSYTWRLQSGWGDDSIAEKEIIQECKDSVVGAVDSMKFILSSLPVILARHVTTRDAIPELASRYIKSNFTHFHLIVEIKYTDFIIKIHYRTTQIYKLVWGPPISVVVLDSREGTF